LRASALLRLLSLLPIMLCTWKTVSMKDRIVS
jgi:hypothetical protein